MEAKANQLAAETWIDQGMDLAKNIELEEAKDHGPAGAFAQKPTVLPVDGKLFFFQRSAKGSYNAREETCSKLVSQRPPAPTNLVTLTRVEGGLNHFKLWHVRDSSSIQASFPPPHKGLQG